jgi:hypothetical protein
VPDRLSVAQVDVNGSAHWLNQGGGGSDSTGQTTEQQPRTQHSSDSNRNGMAAFQKRYQDLSGLIAPRGKPLHRPRPHPMTNGMQQTLSQVHTHIQQPSTSRTPTPSNSSQQHATPSSASTFPSPAQRAGQQQIILFPPSTNNSQGSPPQLSLNAQSQSASPRLPNQPHSKNQPSSSRPSPNVVGGRWGLCTTAAFLYLSIYMFTAHTIVYHIPCTVEYTHLVLPSNAGACMPASNITITFANMQSRPVVRSPSANG